MVAKSYKNTLQAVSINLNDKKATCEKGHFVLCTTLYLTTLVLEIAIMW